MTIGRTLILASILALSGCASCPIPVTIDLPPRPTLIPVSQEMWNRVPLEAQDIWSENDLALKKYAARLEARVAAHNEAVER